MIAVGQKLAITPLWARHYPVLVAFTLQQYEEERNLRHPCQSSLHPRAVLAQATNAARCEVLWPTVTMAQYSANHVRHWQTLELVTRPHSTIIRYEAVWLALTNPSFLHW